MDDARDVRSTAGFASRVAMLASLLGAAAAVPGVALGDAVGGGCAVEPLPVPVVDQLPASASQSLALGVPGRNDRQGTLYQGEDGGFTLVYESGIGAELESSELHVVTSPDGTRVCGPTPITRLPGANVHVPAFVELAGETWLYFASGTSRADPPLLWRVSFDGRDFSTPQRVADIPGLARVLGWPRWTTHEGRLVVSFRDRRSRPHWAVHDPDQPAQPVQIGDLGAAYVRVVPMTGGGWLLSYQRPAPEREFLTYVRISEDGEAWSEPEPVTRPVAPNHVNVHDAFALPRTDRGVDLYYIYPSPREGTPPAGFDLYRRAVLGPGEFGPEQRLTDPADFRVYVPSAHRLRDGRVLLTFSNIITKLGCVGEARLHLAMLPGDAPLTEDGD